MERHVLCAEEDEALPRISGHAVHLCHKVEVLRRLTCADGRGWPRRAGLYASDLLAGHSGGACHPTRGTAGQSPVMPRVGMAQDTCILLVATDYTVIVRRAEYGARCPYDLAPAASGL